ncbi:MAG: hypothetical protein V1734_02720 [Nanoarchaeota archaeon]
MERLERRIRVELIEEKAEDLYQEMFTPKYRAFISGLTDEVVKGLLDDAGKALSKDKLIQEESNIRATMNLVFEPATLKKQARETAEGFYSTKAEKEYFFETARQQLESVITDKGISAELRDLEAPVLEIVDTTDRIIEGLIKVAQAKGIEAALERESRDEVFRQMFPTSDNYMAFISGRVETLKQYIACINKGIYSNADFMEGAPAIAIMMSNILTSAMDFIQQNELRTAERDAKRIYGGN